MNRGLSDIDGDGRLSVQEFCIAMHLIQNKLRGIEVPRVLPYSMRSSVTSAQKIPPKENVQMGINSNALPSRGLAYNTAQGSKSSFGNWSNNTSATGTINLDGAIMNQLSSVSGLADASKSTTMPMQMPKNSTSDANLQQKRANFSDTKGANFSSSYEQLAGFPTSTAASNIGKQELESTPRRGSILTGTYIVLPDLSILIFSKFLQYQDIIN